MNTWLAFKEVGFALSAVMLPIILVTLFLSDTGTIKEYRRALGNPHLYQGVHGVCERVTDEAKLDLAVQRLSNRCILLMLAVIWFTVPFGHSHGWW